MKNLNQMEKIMNLSADKSESPRVLMSESTLAAWQQRLNRRNLFAGAGLLLGGGLLAACGRTTKCEVVIPGVSASTDLVERRLRLFSWANYSDPDVLDTWGDIDITIYNSNEDLIRKLTAANGNGGFDVVVPSGQFIPEMARAGLLEKIDLSRLANFSALDSSVIDQPWDRGNRYSVCKDWGTTGWIYDKRIVQTPIQTWNDFIEAAQGPASGQTSLLDVAQDLGGLYFWANGIDWTNPSTDDLDALEKFLINEMAPHVKALDSSPSKYATQNPYALSQAWSGESYLMRFALEEAGEDPSNFVWGVGAPETELWMDNWAIVKGARHLDAAYDFIDFMLDPLNGYRETLWNGSPTGQKGLQAMIPSDAPFTDELFFTEEEISRMRPSKRTKNDERLVEIFVALQEKIGI